MVNFQSKARFTAMMAKARTGFNGLLLLAVLLVPPAQGLASAQGATGKASALPAERPYRLTPPKDGKLQDLFRWSPGRQAYVSAHRGGPKPGYPEMALETFQEVLTHGPAILEVDVRQTRDGALILMHDRRLDRTTNLTGLVTETTLQDIKKGVLRDNDGTITAFKIPTLAEALRWARGKAIINIDIKRGVDPIDIIAEVKAERAENYVILIAYSLEQALLYETLAPNMMMTVSASTLDQWQAILDSDLTLDNILVWTGTRQRDKALYDAIHRAGRYVVLGTLGFDDTSIDSIIARSGDWRAYEAYLTRGSDILATDRYWDAFKALGYRER